MAAKRAGNPVNMTDVARRAGVSQSTVSRVIGNHPGISEKTRQTVLDALRETGYKAEVLQLVRPEPEEEMRSVTFAMCPLPEQRDPFALEFFSTLADGIREGFAGQNVRLRLETLPAAASELPEEGRNADGVILIGYPSESLRARLRRDGIPCVIASGDIYTRFEDMVTVNNFEAGAEGCRYLLKHGVKRIGFLLNDHNLARYAGFQTELLRNGIAVRPEDFRLLPDTNLNTYIEAIHHWIASGDLPEALVIGYIDAACAVETILRLHDITVPGGIRLIAFDHHPGRRSTIASLHSDPFKIGFRAAKRLAEKMLTGDEGPVQIIVPMTLAASDPD